MHRRTLEELNLLDDFLFYKMVSHPEFGEEFARELLAYMENSCENNATNESLKKIHQMMKRVKSDEEVSCNGMTFLFFIFEN